ncbi:ABC transporter G family member 7 [Porphyridium purpureum]|uniref:Probable ATP-dependent transporter ycf16 n=1 Tax=Porphyridium purpureum TaxID=35688 RepID=A0A5J4YHA9_PORPP|nr:ABC transporter G family member 7 [Porphyridium purpureum]KAA8492889.1 ABC transporter G family member 7 [Porphyridium purpureum]|eukprot:POR7772..scf237_24
MEAAVAMGTALIVPQHTLTVAAISAAVALVKRLRAKGKISGVDASGKPVEDDESVHVIDDSKPVELLWGDVTVKLVSTKKQKAVKKKPASSTPVRQTQGSTTSVRHKGREVGKARGASGIAHPSLDEGTSQQATAKERAPQQAPAARILLDSVSGVAKPGRLLAIMGPSGAGKSTLLDSLAGRLPKSNAIELEGYIFVNGAHAGSASTRNQAYLVQDPVFFSQLTVRETLLFAAQTSTTLRNKDQATCVAACDSLIAKLGLTTCADTCIGDSSARGISGGERKRVALACELLGAPKLVFADEPTTGLDSFQAEKVMQALRKLADEGHTVVISIHQPNERVYKMFDDLLLLAEGGRAVYFGEANDKAAAYFGELGFPLPEHFSHPDHFLELITIDRSSVESQRISELRLDSFVRRFSESFVKPTLPVGTSKHTSRAFIQPIPLGTQLKLLFERSWRQIKRNKRYFMQRMIPSVMSSLLFGIIYGNIGLGQSSVMDRLGLLQVATINTAMLSLVRTLYIFPVEKSVVQSERAKSAYELFPYLASKLVADTPIAAIFPAAFGTILYAMCGLQRSLPKFFSFLAITVAESFTASAHGLVVGALASSVEAAVSIGPNSMTLFTVFGGYYVNSESVPWLLRWVPNISLIRWGFQAKCINEFDGLMFESVGESDVQTGEEALARVGFGDCSVWTALCNELRILGTLYCITYAVLLMKQPKFTEPSVPEPRRAKATVEDVTLGAEDEELDDQADRGDKYRKLVRTKSAYM